jgi:FecR protein
MATAFFAGSFSSLAAAQPAAVGTAVSVVPASTNVRGGTPRTLAIADAIEQDDRIRTGPSGATRVRFRDDTLLTVSANADLLIDRSVFDGSQARSLTIDLAKGALRFVSGSSAPRSYQVNTPVVSIGIRGTIFNVGIFGSRVVTDVTDAEVVICPRNVPLPDPSTPPELVRAVGCLTAGASDPAVVATARGFSRATAQETARLWQLLDGAHLALDRRIGRDPAAYQEAALLRDTAGPLAFPALGPFTSSLLVTGIPDFAGADVVQNAVILPPPPPIDVPPPPQTTVSPPQADSPPQTVDPPPPPRVFPFLGGFGGGSPSLFATPTADPAIVTFRPGNPATVDRIELQNGQIRQRGTAQAVDTGFFSVIGLERWTNGTFSDGGTTTATLSANQGLHVLYGVPATSLPTNTVVDYFNLIHSTSPTISDGSVAPGSLTNAAMSIAFGPQVAGSKVGLEAGVLMPNGENFNFQTTGGTANVSSSQISLQSNGRFSSGGATLPVSYPSGSVVCTGAATCFANVEGFLAGPGGNHAGFIYQFGDIRSVTGGAILREGNSP